jgi:hypothetical protein
MPDPTRLLRTFEQAIRACRDQPGRRGRLVDLVQPEEVLVAGDLHGNIENFRRLLERSQLAKNPGRHLVLQELIHGPFRYPAGGDKSHQLIDLFAALKCQFPLQVHLLLANHEAAQATGQSIAKSEANLNDIFRQGVQTAYGAHAPAVYAAYESLFAVLPLALRTPNRVFLSHSLPAASRLPSFDPRVLTQDVSEAVEFQLGGSIRALLWGRDCRPETVAGFLQKVDADWLITGHIPTAKGFDVPNERQIILDTIGTPAGYCLFPANRAVTHQDLVGFIGTL